MARRQEKFVNGKVFYIIDNSADQVKEIWATDDRFLASASYGPDVERITDETLKRLSLTAYAESE